MFSPTVPRPCPLSAEPMSTVMGTPNTPATLCVIVWRVMVKSVLSDGVGMNFAVSPSCSVIPAAVFSGRSPPVTSSGM